MCEVERCGEVLKVGRGVERCGGSLESSDM